MRMSALTHPQNNPMNLKKKRKYSTPKLTKHGNVENITLKTGSQADFGSNFFQA
ncbi:hypothetical protein SAMN06298216_3956 [Spirosomataceae bacterium TFI 002]|nr:hypothetical protein SAMN06298216_3956 [Spirosomataceae bacterium TFI 002]